MWRPCTILILSKETIAQKQSLFLYLVRACGTAISFILIWLQSPFALSVRPDNSLILTLFLTQHLLAICCPNSTWALKIPENIRQKMPVNIEKCPWKFRIFLPGTRKTSRENDLNIPVNAIPCPWSFTNKYSWPRKSTHEKFSKNWFTGTFEVHEGENNYASILSLCKRIKI